MEAKTNNKSLVYLEGALFLLFASILLPTNVKSIAVGLFCAVAVYHFFKCKNTFNTRFFLVNAAVYFLIVITLIYSDNIAYGVRKLTSFLSLLLFPLCFALFSRNDMKYLYSRLEKFLGVYLVTVVLFNVIPFLWFYITHYSFSDMLIHFPTVMRVDVGKYGIHPIYLSMHCSVAILFSMFILRSLKSKWKIVGVLLLDAILILFLLLYAKKGPILALMIVSTLFILFQRKRAIVRPYIFAILVLLY